MLNTQMYTYFTNNFIICISLQYKKYDPSFKLDILGLTWHKQMFSLSYDLVSAVF